MDDDILTRLRQWAPVTFQYPTSESLPSDLNNAANEIERLRENNEYLHDVIASLRGEVRELEAALPDPPPQHTPVRSTPLTVQPPKEARRG